MIIEVSGRKAGVRGDEPSAVYSGSRWLRRVQPAEPVDHVGVPVRATVEIRLRFGGTSPRALLGGQFAPSTAQELTCQVLVADQPAGLGQPATCDSELGRPLVPGLPDEFADSVLEGIALNAAAAGLPAGQLVVDRAGHDEVNSSPIAFRHTASLLCRVLGAHLKGLDPTDAVQLGMSQW